MKNHFTLLKRLYTDAPIQELYPNTCIEISKGKCEITLPVLNTYFHAAKAVHGSVIFRLLDDATFFAVQSEIFDYFIFTVKFETKLLKPICSGNMTVRAETIESSGRYFCSKAELFNDENKVCASGIGFFLKSKILLSSL